MVNVRKLVREALDSIDKGLVFSYGYYDLYRDGNVWCLKDLNEGVIYELNSDYAHAKVWYIVTLDQRLN